MKVIKLGEIPKQTQQKKCHNCSTVFEFEPSDAKFVSMDGSERYVVCPLCKIDIFVKV